MTFRRVLTVAERFWAKVDRRGKEDCWEWQAARFEKGYGAFKLQARPSIQAKAHRVAYELVNGPIPAGVVIMHRCDNPACVNPAHLSAGSTKENVADKFAKGRANIAKGAAANAKLTEAQVRYARDEVSAGRTIVSVADELRVPWSTLTQAVRRKTWAHVD